MSGEEISRLAKALSELGVCKIRLTGGEPTVRKDFFDILKDMKQNSNIPKVTMTTNGPDQRYVPLPVQGRPLVRNRNHYPRPAW